MSTDNPNSPTTYEEEEAQPAETAPTEESEEDDIAAKLAKSERKWKLVFGFLLLSIIAVVIAAAVVGTQNNKDNDTSSASTTDTNSTEPAPAPTYSAPTPAPVDDAQAQLDIVLEALNASVFTTEYLELLPDQAGALDGKFDDTSLAPVIRAASWLVHEDTLNRPDLLVSRFALATLYLSMGGPGWTDSSNWLSEWPFCDRENGWYGVVCNHLDGVRELDLTGNNLQGSIPNVLALLTDLGALWLDHNSLTGDVPADMLESLPSLEFVYLAGNNFNEPLPANIPDGWLFISDVDQQFPSHGLPFPP